MYKNFHLTESEREQILEQHKSHGYKKPLNEYDGDDEEYFARHGDKDEQPWTGSSNKNYYRTLSDFDSDFDDETYDDFDSLSASYPNFHSHYTSSGDLQHAKGMFDRYSREKGPIQIKKRRIKNEESPTNEDFGNKEIGVVRGNPDFKTQTGRPIGDYVNKRNAANQFQQDFKKEFPDPGKEYKPHWEKDKPSPLDGHPNDLDKSYYTLPSMYDKLNRSVDVPKQEATPNFSKKEKLETLEKKITALRLFKNEFGLDEHMTQLYRNLLIKFEEDSRDFFRGGVK